MGRKKATVKKQRDLNRAEGFYVESHFGTKTIDELVSDLGEDVRDAVAKYAAELGESGFAPPNQSPPKSLVEKAGFAEGKNGVVSMTRGASEKADDFRQGTGEFASVQRPRNDEFFKKRGGGIHIIDPTKPVR